MQGRDVGAPRRRLGCPTTSTITHALYGRWAAGGWGLVITGNVMVDRWALEAPRNVVFDGATGRNRSAGQPSGQERAASALVLVQLSHRALVARRRELAPAPVVLCPELLARAGRRASAASEPVTMTTQEVDDLIKAFGRAARVAVRSGFDGVQVHAAGACYRSSWARRTTETMRMGAARECWWTRAEPAARRSAQRVH